MAHYSHASHVGAALSVVDILYAIYTRAADINKDNVEDLKRDKVILSKGHASIALYAVLAQIGILDDELLERYYIDDGVLPGHLDKDSVLGVDCSAGSLGHGLPIGVGMALAHQDKRVFVVIGDGELNEGSVWEALIFSGKKSLSNLTIIVDSNNLQGFAKCDEIADYSKLADTLNNFGLDAVEVDGHDIEALGQALNTNATKTKVIVAKTVKGKGVSYMENEFVWHYKSPNDEQLAIALSDIDA